MDTSWKYFRIFVEVSERNDKRKYAFQFKLIIEQQFRVMLCCIVFYALELFSIHSMTLNYFTTSMHSNPPEIV